MWRRGTIRTLRARESGRRVTTDGGVCIGGRGATPRPFDTRPGRCRVPMRAPTADERTDATRPLAQTRVGALGMLAACHEGPTPHLVPLRPSAYATQSP